jgi:ketosteroid isomerase-like protein
MATAPALEPFLEQYYRASEQFIRGDPEPMKVLYSRQGEVTLFYPWGGPALNGKDDLDEGMKRSAARYSDGHITDVERITKYVTPDLALLVEVWRFKAKIGGGQTVEPGALRVTQVLRPEDGVWRILHRHADPIVTDRLASPRVAAGS